MKSYDPKKIEPKWQKEWGKKKIYHAVDASKTKKEKFYGLMEFPYPSGDGLHTGHVRGYTAMDIISRKKRMEGRNVLYPIGWDAFGLPTENYAIKTGKQPALITKNNTDIFRKQFKGLGMSFDWSREVNTTDPKYYKWTQWLFLQFLKKGLAYKAKININWCLSCKVGLANEEVVNGKCERCGGETEKREKEQWMLAITKYADRLDKDLDTVDYSPQIKTQQRNWIGKSEGAEIDFEIAGGKRSDLKGAQGPTLRSLKVFTTRPDTIFGATYLVLAPEHPLVKNLIDKSSNKNLVLRYIVAVKKKTDIERTAVDKVKTGVELKGVKAINPATKKEIPIWIADYVLPHYGTGAIMAVPADDARDKEFAEKFHLPIVENYKKAGFEDFGKKITKFKLRDWVFSRQRYWGEPIPVIHCEKCGTVPVPEKDLPVELPKVKNYQPTDTGESPLANIAKWVNVKCPKCKGKAKRETDTMPNWAGSSWYFLRYCDPLNDKEFASMKKMKYWLGSTKQSGVGMSGVDWYNGGNEHTTLHLLYSRFWNKFLFDLGLVPTSEPYMKRTSHGMILAQGGEKMSKSKGNVINPDTIINTYGADTLRLYEMFMGPFDQAIAWSEEAIIGPRRFLEKVWKIGLQIQKNSRGVTPPTAWTLSDKNSSVFAQELKNNFADGRFQPEAGGVSKNYSLIKSLHKTIKKVSEDIESMRFNTAISAMMILATEMDKIQGKILSPQKGQTLSLEDYKKFLQILAPFAPHVTEELWQQLGGKRSDLKGVQGPILRSQNSIHISDWPKWDEKLIKDEEIKIAVQVNGKVRGEIMISSNNNEDEVKKKALENQAILKYVNGQNITKTIYVKNRLINIIL